MEEQTFFNHDGVQVTNARFVVDANTYAIRNITSTAAWTQPRKWLGLIICSFIFIGAVSSSSWVVAAVFLAAAAVFFHIGRPVHFVKLHTSGGEVRAVKSYDLEYVKQVVSALNTAIVSQHK